MADSPGFEARKLLRAARSGVLATVTDGGQPFASLVTHACAPDLSIVLLLSDLSEHTRHLRAEPRCSLLVCGAADSVNPQTAPRVTVTGLAGVIDDPRLTARFLAVHPYAALYAGFGDFHLWRIKPMGALFVGGFARAVRIRADDLLPDPAAVRAVAAAEYDPAAGIAAIDTDGADLAGDGVVRRVHWSSPIADAAGAWAELALLAAGG